MNYNNQNYKGIILALINRNYAGYSAKRFTLNGTNQNVWIPNKHLMEDGTIKSNEDIDYVFRKAHRQLELAGYTWFDCRYQKAISGRRVGTCGN